MYSSFARQLPAFQAGLLAPWLKAQGIIWRSGAPPPRRGGGEGGNHGVRAKDLRNTREVSEEDRAGFHGDVSDWMGEIPAGEREQSPLASVILIDQLFQNMHALHRKDRITSEDIAGTWSFRAPRQHLEKVQRTVRPAVWPKSLQCGTTTATAGPWTWPGAFLPLPTSTSTTAL